MNRLFGALVGVLCSLAMTLNIAALFEPTDGDLHRAVTAVATGSLAWFLLARTAQPDQTQL